MGQSVWYKEDIARIGLTLITVAPSYDFAAGVAALCNAIGAPVPLPPPPQRTVAVIEHEVRK